MLVKELILLLQKYNPEMEVVYSSYREGIQMDIQGVGLEKGYLVHKNEVIAIQEVI